MPKQPSCEKGHSSPIPKSQMPAKKMAVMRTGHDHLKVIDTAAIS